MSYDREWELFVYEQMEKYANNPSNSNKHYAYLLAKIEERESKAFQRVREDRDGEIRKALTSWWKKDHIKRFGEGVAFTDDYLPEGTTLSGDIFPVINSINTKEGE